MFWHRHPVSGSDLSAYVDGQLGEAARGRVDAHIDACASCREALAELRALRSAIRELPRASAPRSFSLREADVQPLTPQPSGFSRAMPALSAVAMVAFLGFWALVGLDASGWPSEETDLSGPGTATTYQLEVASDRSAPLPQTGPGAGDGPVAEGGGEGDGFASDGEPPPNATSPVEDAEAYEAYAETPAGPVGAVATAPDAETPPPPVSAEELRTPAGPVGTEEIETDVERLPPPEVTKQPETRVETPAPPDAGGEPAANADTPAPSEGAQPADEDVQSLERDQRADRATPNELAPEAELEPAALPAERDDSGEDRLRAGQAAAAAVAVVAGGSLAVVWWRRRT